MLRTGLYVLFGILLSVAIAFYHFIIDGDVPRKSSFDFDLSVARALVDGSADQRPHAIEVEVVARREVPRFAIQAGSFGAPVTMARAVFQLKSDWGDTLIDVGMNRDVARMFSPEEIFDDKAFARIHKSIGQAERISFTHEHPDHIGYIARYPELDQLVPALRMTATQIRATAMFTEDRSVPAALANIERVSEAQPTIIAPGVVMIPAPGHTPGSMMFYVRMQDESEALIVGDIVWNMSNIRDQKGRPRFVQKFVMPDNEVRSDVYHQVSWLVQIAAANPDLIILPSHDEDHINTLIADGIVAGRFSSAP